MDGIKYDSSSDIINDLICAISLLEKNIHGSEDDATTSTTVENVEEDISLVNKTPSIITESSTPIVEGNCLEGRGNSQNSGANDLSIRKEIELNEDLSRRKEDTTMHKEDKNTRSIMNLIPPKVNPRVVHICDNGKKIEIVISKQNKVNEPSDLLKLNENNGKIVEDTTMQEESNAATSIYMLNDGTIDKDAADTSTLDPLSRNEIPGDCLEMALECLVKNIVAKTEKGIALECLVKNIVDRTEKDNEVMSKKENSALTSIVNEDTNSGEIDTINSKQVLSTSIDFVRKCSSNEKHMHIADIDCKNDRSTKKRHSKYDKFDKYICHSHFYTVDHETERTFQCDICNQSFLWKAALTQHRKTHVQQPRHTEPTSNVQPRLVPPHIQQHCHIQQPRCIQPRYILPRYILPRYILPKPPPPPPPIVDANNVVVSLLSEMVMLIVNGEDKDTNSKKRYAWNFLRCHICNKGFTCKSKRDRHTVTHRYKCDYCEKYFSTDLALRKHTVIHNGEKPYKCNECGKCFMKCSSLKEHNMASHSNEKAYKCETCEKNFATMRLLKSHMQVHTGEKKEKKHSCGLCGKRFHHIRELLVHSRTHTGEKPFQCHICGKGFACKNGRYRHTKTHRYKCDYCEKYFSTNLGLRKHTVIHNGEKPYKCNECGKGFMKSTGLIEHTMASHSGEKAYKCESCNKSFASKARLKTHTKIHTGELRKPYECETCGKAFSSSANLKVHFRVHSGEKPYKCEKCDKSYSHGIGLKKHNDRVHNNETQ